MGVASFFVKGFLGDFSVCQGVASPLTGSCIMGCIDFYQGVASEFRNHVQAADDSPPP